MGIIEKVEEIIVRVIFLPLYAQNPKFLVAQAYLVALFFYLKRHLISMSMFLDLISKS